MDVAKDGVFEFPRDKEKRLQNGANHTVSNKKVQNLNITNIVKTVLRDVLVQMKALSIKIHDSEEWKKIGIPFNDAKNFVLNNLYVVYFLLSCKL